MIASIPGREWDLSTDEHKELILYTVEPVQS
jgi:hypothetical protein